MYILVCFYNQRLRTQVSMIDEHVNYAISISQHEIQTLSLSLSLSFCSLLFSPSFKRSTSLTVSPDRVLNFFLKAVNVYD